MSNTVALITTKSEKSQSLYAGLEFSRYTGGHQETINSPVRHSCWLTSWRWYSSSLRNTGKVTLSGLRLRPQGLSATGHGHPWSNNNTHTLSRYLCYGHLNGAASQRLPPQSWGSQTRAPGSSAVGLIPRVPSDSGKGFHGVAYEGVRETARQIINSQWQPFCKGTQVQLTAFNSPALGYHPPPHPASLFLWMMCLFWDPDLLIYPFWFPRFSWGQV